MTRTTAAVTRGETRWFGLRTATSCHWAARARPSATSAGQTARRARWCDACSTGSSSGPGRVGRACRDEPRSEEGRHGSSLGTVERCCHGLVPGRRHVRTQPSGVGSRSARSPCSLRSGRPAPGRSGSRRASSRSNPSSLVAICREDARDPPTAPDRGTIEEQSVPSVAHDRAVPLGTDRHPDRWVSFSQKRPARRASGRCRRTGIPSGTCRRSSPRSTTSAPPSPTSRSSSWTSRRPAAPRHSAASPRSAPSRCAAARCSASSRPSSTLRSPSRRSSPSSPASPTRWSATRRASRARCPPSSSSRPAASSSRTTPASTSGSSRRPPPARRRRGRDSRSSTPSSWPASSSCATSRPTTGCRRSPRSSARRPPPTTGRCTMPAPPSTCSTASSSGSATSASTRSRSCRATARGSPRRSDASGSSPTPCPALPASTSSRTAATASSTSARAATSAPGCARYFTASEQRSRMAEMVRLAHVVHPIVCQTSLEAQVRELRLIDEHKPRFNRRSKDGRKVIWVKLTQERFPRLSIVKQVRDDGAHYIGPFRSRATAQAAIDAVHEVVPLRQCTGRLTGVAPPAPSPTWAAAARRAPARSPRATTPSSSTSAAPSSPATPGPSADLLRARLEELASQERFEDAARVRDRFLQLVRGAARAQRLAPLVRSPEIVAARRSDLGGWELVSIRHGRLAGTAVSPRGADPMHYVRSMQATAEVVPPVHSRAVRRRSPRRPRSCCAGSRLRACASSSSTARGPVPWVAPARCAASSNPPSHRPTRSSASTTTCPPRDPVPEEAAPLVTAAACAALVEARAKVSP